MLRFAQFVDGSNLSGSLKSMNLQVTDYETFFGYIHDETVKYWAKMSRVSSAVPTQMYRVYWYVVGTIDRWDLASASSQTALEKAFMADKEVKSIWMAEASKKDSSLKGTALSNKAWADCHADFTVWYNQKLTALEGVKKFHQAIRFKTDLIDVVECGHWKVNFLRKYLEEKGVDTSLAVDMVAYANTYDMAIVASGDADSIPSVKHLKSLGKHVCSVEFVNGSPPESKGRSFSSRLGEESDFVVQIFESDLLKHKIAERPSP